MTREEKQKLLRVFEKRFRSLLNDETFKEIFKDSSDLSDLWSVIIGLMKEEDTVAVFKHIADATGIAFKEIPYDKYEEIFDHIYDDYDLDSPDIDNIKINDVDQSYIYKKKKKAPQTDKKS